MNYIWGSMILIGVIWGTLTGKVGAISEALLDSAREAVTLCITMLGVMGLWMGLMEIAKEAGLIRSVSRLIRPFIRFLFPNIPKDHPANEHITLNCVSNILGLGWAATPAGLLAMEDLALLEEERRAKKKKAAPRGVASSEMCTFLILNISSLHLIPVNIIAYRTQYGSVDPGAILGPGIAATAVSTGAAILFCKIMERKK